MSRIDHITAFNLAIDLAKKAGFVFSHASRNSESCYYYHPARGKGYLLRLSTHKTKRSPIGLKGVVVAKASFSEGDLNCYEASVMKKMLPVIGRYFLSDNTMRREYKGLKGTWEKSDERTQTSQLEDGSITVDGASCC